MEVEIILDGVMEDLLTVNKDIKLNELREQIKLEKDFLFLNKDNIPIKNNLEKKINLDKIVKDNKIFLKSNSEDISLSKINIQLNMPINGSIELLKRSNLTYYHYPKIEFTSEEDDQSKVVLLVGKTGDGKSTFINALVNLYMGIKLEDNFRYLIINEDTTNQTKTITKDITIYNIRGKEGLNYPPLKIIDTPGFGDTGGIEEDQKHINLFQNVFQNKLLSVNCICFIVKAETRVDFHQNYVFNCIMSLFAENVKDNFIVGVTNYIPYKKNDLPNIIASCLSREDSFYYQNILKKDNITREDILKNDWYFACDNKIIFDSDIDKDDYDVKINFEKTVNKIKIFIEKIKRLESKPIKESSNVIKKRLEIQNEISGLTEKLDNLNEDKKRCEYNKKELSNYLLDINKQEKFKFEIENEKNNREIKSDQNKADIQLTELLNKKEEESHYINRLEVFIQKLIKEKNIVINKIEKYKNKIKQEEIEIIQILNKIKINLDYLRKNSLNKEFNKTMESSLDTKIKIADNIGDINEKTNLEKLKKIFIQLIEIENIDISDITMKNMKK